jgi:hypothetical protein
LIVIQKRNQPLYIISPEHSHQKRPKQAPSLDEPHPIEHPPAENDRFFLVVNFQTNLPKVIYLFLQRKLDFTDHLVPILSLPPLQTVYQINDRISDLLKDIRVAFFPNNIVDILFPSIPIFQILVNPFDQR